MVVEKKKTLGRRKIEMKKIEKLSNRRVTFSKRRVGLFKKASEICVQTGAEIAIIVQSLAGKRVFAFGHSSVDSVIDRFENRITSDDSVKDYAQTPDFKRDYSVVSAELEAEKRRQRDGVNDDGGFWWDMEVEDLELDELEMFKGAMEEELKNLKTKAESSSLITEEEFKILNTKAETSSSPCSLITAAPASGITWWNPIMEAYC